MSNKKGYLLKSSIFDGVNMAFLLMVVAYYLAKPTEEELLNLNLLSLMFFCAFGLGIFISVVLNKKNIMTWGSQIFKPSYQKSPDPVAWYKTLWGWQATLIFILTLVIGMIITKVSLYEITNIDGFEGAKRLFKGISNPDWSILPRAVINIIETLFMAFIATILAIPVAFTLSFLSARNVMRSPLAFVVYLALRTFFNVVRSVEALIWAIIFSVWVGIGPFAGMLALMIHSIASLAKQYSEMVESVSEGPIEGVLSTGANSFQVIWYAIVPQIILPYISFTVYRWDINVRMATIIGLVGGGGIGTLLIQYQGQAMWPQVGCIIVVIAVVVWLLDQASAYLREALK